MELSKKKKRKRRRNLFMKKLILEDLTKEELIEIIKIQNDYEEWIRKQHSEKKSLKFMYINITKNDVNYLWLNFVSCLMLPIMVIENEWITEK